MNKPVCKRREGDKTTLLQGGQALPKAMKLSFCQLKTPTLRAPAAFTLIESVLALGIVSVMLTSLYACFSSGFAAVRTSRENLRATQILLTRLEAVRLSTFEQLTNTLYNPPTFTEAFDPKDQAAGSGGTVYSGTFSSVVPPSGSLPDSYRTNMQLVTVSVTWTSGQLSHTRSLQTYATRQGLQPYVANAH